MRTGGKKVVDMPRDDSEKTIQVNVRFIQAQIKIMDDLIKIGYAKNRPDFVYDCVKKEMKSLGVFDEALKELGAQP